jgi:glycosyltransferase involved in cell wall biosynthesis
MQHFKIIINCGLSEPYIAKCVESALAQVHGDWNALITVDAPHDRTFEAAVAASRGDSRISIIENKTRMYTMYNLAKAIERSAAGPEDVIVVLDGDDWFATPKALEIIADTYARHDCWMTYGSWLSNLPEQNGEPDGLWPAYPPGTVNFRKVRWLGTAARTWKKWLWDYLDDSDLRDASGQYFRVSEDQAVMLPMLEISGTERARHIPDVLMIYNKLNPAASALAMADDMHRHAAYLERLPPRQRLAFKAYRGTAAAVANGSSGEAAQASH